MREGIVTCSSSTKHTILFGIYTFPGLTKQKKPSKHRPVFLSLTEKTSSSLLHMPIASR
jgi:hypothetical protein